MTLGTGIVIVMLLYLLDKHGLLKRAAVIVAIVAVLALGWLYVAKWYKNWSYTQGQRQLRETEAALVKKYQDALPDLPAGAILNPPVSNPVFVSGLCKEASFMQLADWEKMDVVQQIMPKADYFDRRAVIDKCPVH
jgi:hypothetical protein